MGRWTTRGQHQFGKDPRKWTEHQLSSSAWHQVHLPPHLGRPWHPDQPWTLQPRLFLSLPLHYNNVSLGSVLRSGSKSNNVVISWIRNFLHHERLKHLHRPRGDRVPRNTNRVGNFPRMDQRRQEGLGDAGHTRLPQGVCFLSGSYLMPRMRRRTSAIHPITAALYHNGFVDLAPSSGGRPLGGLGKHICSSLGLALERTDRTKGIRLVQIGPFHCPTNQRVLLRAHCHSTCNGKFL